MACTLWNMASVAGLLLSCLIFSTSGSAVDWDKDEFYYGTFPEGFIWGSASSSHQVEGAWDLDGKSPSIWDTYSRVPGSIADGSNADIACDSYHKYMDDVKILKDMEVEYYRFSIAWPRIFPNEDDIEPNPEGLAYYNTLIDALLAENIEPIVTIFHWDLPQWIDDKGGWLNETLVVEEFGILARVCFHHFGDRVKYWITINEPWVISWLGYGTGTKAPGRSESPGEEVYIAGHSCILAHAEAWHIYNDEFRDIQNGEIGITLNGGYAWPLDPDNPLDVEAADRMMVFDFGWFADPIFLNGEYPPEMVERIGNKSFAEGRETSRLPEFTEEESNWVKGTSDFFGINFYTGSLVEHKEQPINPSYYSDKDLIESKHPTWPESGSSWLRVVPPSMRGILNWIKDRYDNPPVFVTENGVSDRNQSLHDEHRISYFRGYINNMLKAIDLDGCNVVGYMAWSLMDNFEWEYGYLEYFGIHLTNFSSPGLERIPKDSARYLTQIVKQNGFLKTSPEPTLPGPTIPDNSAPRVAVHFTIIMPVLFLLIL